MNLKEFFIDENITIPYKLFGKTHIFLLLIVIIGTILIIKNKQKLIKTPLKIKKRITKTLAIVYLLNMLVLYVSSIYYHNFDYKTMLPLHLCYLSNYFYIYTILFNKKNLYQYNYFLSFLGPIPAIIFFDCPSFWESFNFYLYLISHHLFMLGGILTFYFYPKNISKKDILKLFISLNILYFFMNIFNNYFHTNYFFSKSIPLFILKIFPFLNNLNPTIILEIMEILIMFILYKFWQKEYFSLKNNV